MNVLHDPHLLVVCTWCTLGGCRKCDTPYKVFSRSLLDRSQSIPTCGNDRTAYILQMHSSKYWTTRKIFLFIPTPNQPVFLCPSLEVHQDFQSESCSQDSLRMKSPVVVVSQTKEYSVLYCCICFRLIPL